MYSKVYEQTDIEGYPGKREPGCGGGDGILMDALEGFHVTKMFLIRNNTDHKTVLLMDRNTRALVGTLRHIEYSFVEEDAFNADFDVQRRTDALSWRSKSAVLLGSGPCA